MKRAEIEALVRAHRGRARPVAFLHVLRQPALEADDHEFLCEHARALAVPDLLAWRARCAPGFTGVVIRALARIAIDDPSQFEHEVLAAPGFSLAEEEWIELADLARGKVPPALFERIAARGAGGQGAPAAVAPPRGYVNLGAFINFAFDIIDPDGEMFPPAEPASAVDAAAAPEAILERARCAFSADERAMLLQWLEGRGFSRRVLVDIALGAVRGGELGKNLIGWLAGQLGTRAAWEAHGVDVVLSFVDRGALGELSELFAQAWSFAGAATSEGEPRGLLEAMHGAFAGALVQASGESLSAGMPARALSALSALACLDPPARLSRSIHDLARVPGVDGEVRALIELNVRLVKHGKAREASLAGVVAAIHSLADTHAEA